MKTCVLIPSYNEAKTIGSIIGQLKSKGLDVVVVDDGSSDETAKIATTSGAKVMSRAKNLGKGASIKEGFDYILKNNDYESVIIMDGDGQHHTEDVDKFIEHANKYNDDLIIGNRMGYTKNMPAARFLTNKFTSYLISLLCKEHIPDTQCGFRLLRRNAIKKLNLESSKYDTESEMLINAAQNGLKIASVPIKTIYGREKSRIQPARDTIRFFALLIKALFKTAKK